MNISINTKDFDLKFPLLVEAQKAKVRRVILITGQKVVNNAMRRAPVLSGDLRDTINQKPDLANYKTSISSGVHYDIYNEVRKPFFAPALEMEKAEFLRNMKDALR